MHSHKIVHNNIKPDTILISENAENNTLYLVNYKYAIVNDDNLKLVFKSTKNSNLASLNKFSSLNKHLNVIPSYKDDLESFIYILLYFYLKGDLFTLNKEIKIFGKENILEYYMNEKLNLIPEIFFKGLPSYLYDIYIFIKNLNIDEYPNYNYIRNILKNNVEIQAYDWVTKGISSGSNTQNITKRKYTTDTTVSNEDIFIDGLELLSQTILIKNIF